MKKGLVACSSELKSPSSQDETDNPYMYLSPKQIVGPKDCNLFIYYLPVSSFFFG
jgi:hypothetical protein